jgi:hypothetical protein
MALAVSATLRSPLERLRGFRLDAVVWAMPETFVVARNPAAGTRLPYLLRLPVDGTQIVLAARDRWPGNRDVFCYELPAWPEDAEVLEQVEVARCRRRGASVELVLLRRQRRRSLFVWTRKGGRVLVFWRSERSMRAARPGVRVPQAQGLEGPLTIAVDERERYAWRFASLPVTTERRSLPAGDYAVFVGTGSEARLVGAVERKRANELAAEAIAGKLALTLAELAALPRAAVIVEGRLSQLLKPEVEVRKGWLLNLVAGLQVAYPNVPLLFAETPKLAADLAYRWLSAASRLARAAGQEVSLAEALAWDAADGANARSAVEARAVPLQSPLFEAAPQWSNAATVRHSDAPLARAERQENARERARLGEVWTVAAYAQAFGVSRATASNDLWELADQGSLRALGNRRSLRFEPAGPLETAYGADETPG